VVTTPAAGSGAVVVVGLGARAVELRRRGIPGAATSRRLTRDSASAKASARLTGQPPSPTSG